MIRDRLRRTGGRQRRELYAAPRRGLRREDCDFYHTFEIPDIGLVRGQWDLRGREAEYLGNVHVAGKRVLEIGPASGFITWTLERAGASVVAVETAPDAPWDMVPQASLDLRTRLETRQRHMERIRNSWWLVHERCALEARVHYGHGADVPDELGRFDIAVLAAVLLHCRDPLAVLEAAATRAEVVIVVDLDPPGVTGPLARLVPTRENQADATWWEITPDLVNQYLGVLGFQPGAVTRHVHTFNPDVEWDRETYEKSGGSSAEERPLTFFTVVAHR